MGLPTATVASAASHAASHAAPGAAGTADEHRGAPPALRQAQGERKAGAGSSDGERRIDTDTPTGNRRGAAPVAGGWPWPPLLKASVACHLGAAATVLAAPALWPWAAGAVALDHALITAAGLWPRSTWLGANWLRLPAAAAARGAVALTIDDGPDPEVTPAVLDLLDAHGARATFFCIAAQAARHPALCREIVRRGHSVQNHSHDHGHGFSLRGPRAIEADVWCAQQTLADITGTAPVFFRAPAGLRNVFLAPVLHRLGLQLASWTRRGYDTTRTTPDAVLARLTRGLGRGDIVLLHDGHAARSDAGVPVVVAVLPALLGCIAAAGLHTETLVEAQA